MEKNRKTIFAMTIAVFLLSCSIVSVIVLNTDHSESTHYNKEMNITGSVDDDVVVYKGIQYAKPPAGDLRYKAPVAADPYPREKNVDCTEWGEICWQIPKTITHGTMGEDCLNLNVWASSHASKGDKLPVYVWLHGGGNSYGDSISYDCHQFAEDGVVCVTLNHRLGGLGFLATEEWKDEIYNGNFGTLDIICALRWVHQYIDKFGGDPENVTIGGISSGSYNVFNLILLSEEKSNDNNWKTGGLFQKAIMESGVVSMTLNVCTPKLAKMCSHTVMEEIGCYDETTGEDITKLMQIADDNPQWIMKKSQFNINILALDKNQVWPMYGSWEGSSNPGLLPEDPIQVIRDGHYDRNVKILMGMTLNEGYTYTSREMSTREYFDPMLKQTFGEEEYNGWAKTYYDQKIQEIMDQGASENDAVYAAATEVIEMGRFRLGTSLAADVFSKNASSSDNVYCYQYNYNDGTPPIHASEVKHAFAYRTALEKGDPFTMMLHSYWVSFIKNGNPNHDGAVEWKPYDDNSKLYMLFDKECKVGKSSFQDTMDILMPHLFKE